MKRHELKVEKRIVLGKKVKKLRRDGILPGNVFGKDFKSVSIQMPLESFKTVYKEAGETGLVDLTLGNEAIPTLIKNVATDYKNNFLHADFHKVNLKEKVKAMIPLEFVGTPNAVSDNIGILMHIISEVEVEGLPTDLPENIEVNVEPLTQIDEQITVADLKKPEGVEILTDSAQIVTKIGELITKEAQAELEAEAAAAEAAKAEAQAAAGVPAEGAEAVAGEEGVKPEGEGEDKSKGGGEEENRKAQAPKEETQPAGGQAKPKEEPKG